MMLSIWGLTLLVLSHVAIAEEEAFAIKGSRSIDQLKAAERTGELDKSGPEYLDFLTATGRHEEFAKLMKIEDVSLVKPSEGKKLENPIFTKASPLGDIMLTPEQTEQARQGINKKLHTSYKWQNHEVPIYVNEKDFSQEELNVIYRALNKMNADMRNIQLRSYRRGDKNYVYIYRGEGCWSYLGCIGGEQPLSLGDGCVYLGTVTHEAMHAIGFTHEHNRSDRDDNVEVEWDNISEDWKSQYNKVEEPDFLNYGSYDYYSVMHYPNFSPSDRSKTAFKFKKNVDESRVGKAESLTDIDRQKIDKLYA